MELSIPTNWDDQLIPGVAGLPVKEFYGKFQSDYFGGGRPYSFLPSTKLKNMRRHLELIHKNGYTFNYLLNATCMDNAEFTRTGQRKMRKFVGHLVENGVDEVTVSIPYLARWIRKNYPSLKIKASIMAEIDSVSKARQWQDLGVESMILGLECNRDFPLLGSIVKNIKCKISLIVNLACMKSCAFSQYHYLLISHASQSEHRIKHFFINYCRFFCSYLRLIDPSRFISAGWIRPEDIAVYENAGVCSFKIIDRTFPTAKIIKVTQAYANRRYEGDLLDLVVAYREEAEFSLEKFMRVAKSLFHPGKIRPSFLKKLFKLMVKKHVVVDNRALDGFLEHLRQIDCRLNDCHDCRYCQRVAEQAVKIDAGCKKELESAYQEILGDLEAGTPFRFGL